MQKVKPTAIKTLDMVYIALLVALMAVCSWVSIPATVPFTMQTFAVFCAVGLLGGKRGTIAVAVYILLGLVGVPVFAGFKGGIGALLGVTGGYVIGFIFVALIYWIITKLFGDKTMVMAIAMFIGLLVCYAFGTAWFVFVYAKGSGSIGFAAAFGLCVAPFIVPDIIKIFLSIFVVKRVSKHIKKL
ncbi:MAG: biotin transporter BioY [Clostridia bacterium]|nr:biotin transporter BioY [Clostridia bacterium]